MTLLSESPPSLGGKTVAVNYVVEDNVFLSGDLCPLSRLLAGPLSPVVLTLIHQSARYPGERTDHPEGYDVTPWWVV